MGFLNRWTAGTPLKVQFELSGLGLDHSAGYQVTEVFTGQNLGKFSPWDTFQGQVNPTGILLLRFNVLPEELLEKKTTDGGDNADGGKVNKRRKKGDKVIKVFHPGLSGWRSEL